MTPPALTTARLTLGPITAAPAEAFIAFCSTGASRFIGGPAVSRDGWEGAAICAGLWALCPIWRAESELTWVICPAHQRRGYATEAARAARDRCATDEAPHPFPDSDRIRWPHPARQPARQPAWGAA